MSKQYVLFVGQIITHKVHELMDSSQRASFRQLGEGKTVITRAHCMRFIGRPVVIRTRDGVTHHGILHSVTSDGVYVRPVRGGDRLVNETGVSTANIDLLKNMPQPKDGVEEAFFPFLFLPFLALAALGPWGWW